MGGGYDKPTYIISEKAALTGSLFYFLMWMGLMIIYAGLLHTPDDVPAIAEPTRSLRSYIPP